MKNNDEAALNHLLFPNELFTANGSQYKEIIGTGGDTTFVGTPHVFLNLTNNYNWSFNFEQKIENPVRTKLKDLNFDKYKNDIESLLSDPSYQFNILEFVTGNVEKFWLVKRLDCNWTQCKEFALNNVRPCILKTLELLEIEISTSYTIDLSKVNLANIKTPQSLIGVVGINFIKSCQSFDKIVDLIVPSIEKMIAEDLTEHIQQDYYRMENDIMTLNSLIKKYPNYQELLQKTTA